MQLHIFFAFLFLVQSFAACQQGTEGALPLAAGIGFPAPCIAAPWQVPVKSLPPAANIVFQSVDGGQTWQDVSAGLPREVQAWNVVSNGDKVFLNADGGLFGSTASAAPVLWEEQLLPGKVSDIFPGRSGMYASCEQKGCFLNALGLSYGWMPAFNALKGEWMRTVLETPDGAVLAGCNTGIFKSADGGQTWKKVLEKGIVSNLVAAADGVLFACSYGAYGGHTGVLRSTDGGEHWDLVLSEDGMSFRTSLVEGGVAVILNNDGTPRSQERLLASTDSVRLGVSSGANPRSQERLLASTDGGKTWQGMDDGLPPSRMILDLEQAGKYLFCSIFNDGLYRSSDRGKTWELVLSAYGESFQVAVSGPVIYAVSVKGGC